jgi:hypothetical protein
MRATGFTHVKLRAYTYGHLLLLLTPISVVGERFDMEFEHLVDLVTLFRVKAI